MNNENIPAYEQNPWAPRRPVWDDWKSTTHLRLWEAISLACDLDPKQFNLRENSQLCRIFNPPPPHFEELIIAAKGAIGAGGILKPINIGQEGFEECKVSLANFGAWAKSIKISLPPEFPRQDEETAPLNKGWPWGDYETDLLRKLAAAANRFWKNYDPSDPTTAPTNDQVIHWLMKQDVAERTAQIMATILRADGLRTGPRK